VRPRRAAAARPGLTRSRQLEDLDGVREALHRDGPERLHLDVALGEPHGLAGQPRGPGRRELLHAGRQMRGLPHGRVVHAEIAADRPHHDLAGVQADADLHFHTLCTAQLVRVALHGLLHPERGVTRAHRVVLVSERRSEERHEPIAHHLVDRALVAVHGVHHALEHGIQDPPRVLRVAVGEQLHRTLQIGEDHGHLLALAFKGGLRSQDPLREVLRGVGLGRGDARGRHLAGGVGALRAELGSRCERGAAVGTGAGQWRGALFAELRARAILVMAPHTLHGESPLTPPSESSRITARSRPGRMTSRTHNVKAQRRGRNNRLPLMGLPS
jgi:hypothetical protein